MVKSEVAQFPLVSVIIPARNEESLIGTVVRNVIRQCPAGTEVEVIVVDDGSDDQTALEAQKAGAIVLDRSGSDHVGNPAIARNCGVQLSKGDPVIFLDADCVPLDGWLQAILLAHQAGEVIVGGALELPPGLSFTARCDYYCGWYLVHPKRPAGHVPNHPPPNLSVRRSAFLGTSGFTEHPPLNEERQWQAELRRAGHQIYFEPKAVAYHYNHPGFMNLLRRNYNWAYTALEKKSTTGSARLSWLYRYPRLLIVLSLPLVLVHTVYILGCWMRAGVFEPVLMLPVVLASRVAYMAGMVVGGIEWLRRGKGVQQVGLSNDR